MYLKQVLYVAGVYKRKSLSKILKKKKEATADRGLINWFLKMEKMLRVRSDHQVHRFAEDKLCYFARGGPTYQEVAADRTGTKILLKEQLVMAPNSHGRDWR